MMKTFCLYMLLITGAHAQVYTADTLCSTSSRGYPFDGKGVGIAATSNAVYDKCRLAPNTDAIECLQQLRCYDLTHLTSEHCQTFSNGKSFEFSSDLPNFAHDQVLTQCAKTRGCSPIECFQNISCKTVQTVPPPPPPAPANIEASSKVMFRGELLQTKLRAMDGGNLFRIDVYGDYGTSFSSMLGIEANFSNKVFLLNYGEGITLIYQEGDIVIETYPARSQRVFSIWTSRQMIMERVFLQEGVIHIQATDINDDQLYETTVGSVGARWKPAQH